MIHRDENAPAVTVPQSAKDTFSRYLTSHSEAQVSSDQGAHQTFLFQTRMAQSVCG